MSNIQKMMGILGFVVVLGTGIENASADCPTSPENYTCECNTAETRWVCAKFGAGGVPTHNSDFFVAYSGDIPEVKFKAADDAWEVYSEKLNFSGAVSRRILGAKRDFLKQESVLIGLLRITNFLDKRPARRGGQ